MYSQVKSAVISGIDAYLVTLEADVSNGLPIFEMVGFLSTQVKESKERVRTAIRNCGFVMPAKRITVNIAPASIRKTGSGFDLPLAIAILAAMEVINVQEDYLFIGELGLSGLVLPINGVLPTILMAKEKGISKCFVPKQNLNEAKLVSDIDVIGVENLKEIIEYINSGILPDQNIGVKYFNKAKKEYDFAMINGQSIMRRACEIAVSGMHNLLMVGPPGAGKTLMAKCIPTILPQLNMDEKLELSKIYSVCGLYKNRSDIISDRPFRNPHHTISAVGLTGGGNPVRPGEISLAHNGILFLDELPEFSKSTLEILRQPMEDGTVNIVRGNGSYTFPSNFMLVAAMNPCLCGYYPDLSKCRCNKRDVNRYLNKLSQPLLDRIDICVEALNVSFLELTHKEDNESSENIRKRVTQCHDLQNCRYSNESFNFNSQIPSSQIDEYCYLSEEEKDFMESIFDSKNLTARTYHKILRVARTIADMEASEEIKKPHLTEALMYRGLDKRYWENCL